MVISSSVGSDTLILIVVGLVATFLAMSVVLMTPEPKKKDKVDAKKTPSAGNAGSDGTGTNRR